MGADCMFGATMSKTLIVVYKDELYANQIKKLIETKDDCEDGQAVGTKDDSVKVVAWNEKTWLANKKAGNIDSKLLFIGDVKGVDKLIPVIDVVFDKYGVKYGWAGKQAVIFIEPSYLSNYDKYLEFLDEIKELPMPDSIKSGIEPLNTEKMDTAFEKAKDIKIDKISEKFKKIIVAGVERVEKASNTVAKSAHGAFKDKPTVKKQMLFYGIFNLYRNDLETFMNL